MRHLAVEGRDLEIEGEQRVGREVWAGGLAGLLLATARFLPDGDRVVLAAREDDGPLRLFIAEGDAARHARWLKDCETVAAAIEGFLVTITGSNDDVLVSGAVATGAVVEDGTAQATGTSIGVLGNIPITFTDYGIDNPSNPGVSLEDEGIVEFVLVFERG